jgi:pescadillo protein
MLKSKRIAGCAQLCREFQYYLILTRSLKKTFISIKGYYYQAVVFGQTVTWLVPHNFTPKVPGDVDLSVMLTFLELYETLLGFVNFRLFQSIGLRYPPVIDYSKLKDNEFYASLRFERENADEFDEAEKATHEEMKEVFTEYSAAINTSTRKNPEVIKKLFEGLKFYISREVPREALEFVIRCFGGSVSYEGSGTYLESDESITHQITDRPLIIKSSTREYVQPQWVFDSVNNQILLPAYEYAVNAKLPPHLSPFVNDEAAGYVPERRQKLDEIISLARGIIPSKNKDKNTKEKVEIEDDSDDEFDAAKLLENRYANEFDKEAAGQSYSKDVQVEDEKAVDNFVKNRLLKKKRTERQQHHFREMMIPTHRKRRTYTHVQVSKKRKQGRLNEIRNKRAKIDDEKNDMATD